jgi:hypothetical protein
VIVGRWLQLAGVVKRIERNGDGDHVVAMKPNGFPSGESGSGVAVASSGV